MFCFFIIKLWLIIFILLNTSLPEVMFVLKIDKILSVLVYFTLTWPIMCLIFVGIKLVIELIPNHTSRRHKWFVQSRQDASNPYSNFYIWDNGRRFENGTRYPPNNWVLTSEHFVDSSLCVYGVGSLTLLCLGMCVLSPSNNCGKLRSWKVYTD